MTDSEQEFWAKTFPGSIRAWEFDAQHGTNYYGGNKDMSNAKFERGKHV